MQIGVYLRYYSEVHNTLIVATIERMKNQLLNYNDLINKQKV